MRRNEKRQLPKLPHLPQFPGLCSSQAPPPLQALNTLLALLRSHLSLRRGQQTVKHTKYISLCALVPDPPPPPWMPSQAHGTFAIHLLKKLCEENPSHNVWVFFFSPKCLLCLGHAFPGVKGKRCCPNAQRLPLQMRRDCGVVVRIICRKSLRFLPS